MALIAQVDLVGVTKEQYDQVREAAGWIERSPDGGIAEPQVTFHPAHEVFLPAGSN